MYYQILVKVMKICDFFKGSNLLSPFDTLYTINSIHLCVSNLFAKEHLILKHIK